ncbi:hypothetical protein GUJ93_ZPchr0007g4669 [Zizania palustris]|uniref:Uncharacterized protein n=1 Tax=Zizania palustris TaxID=103762 RepID=A0A8J5SNP4_ZIZPA|nr:hypothetical protein GUJ93_ZPchr0007g4669 [Zizania palustris]
MADKGEFFAGGEPIRPLPLEDTGLKDCSLLSDPIVEAFLLAAMAVSSRLAHLSFFDDDENDDDRSLTSRVRYGGGCVDDSVSTFGAISDALVACTDDDVVVGGRGEVVAGGSGDDDDKVLIVGKELD